MENEVTFDDNDIKTVFEAHGLLPEGDLLDDALGVARLYADRIQQLLSKAPAEKNEENPLGNI